MDEIKCLDLTGLLLLKTTSTVFVIKFDTEQGGWSATTVGGRLKVN